MILELGQEITKVISERLVVSERKEIIFLKNYSIKNELIKEV